MDVLDLNKYSVLNNSFKKKLVFRIGCGAGFFSEYNNMILAMHYCLVNKIQFVLNSKGANFSSKKGWTDYFIPFCKDYNCNLLSTYNHRIKPAYLNKTDRYIYNIYKRLNGINYFTYHLFDLIRSEPDLNIPYLIDELGLNGTILENCSKLHKMVWRYQPNTENEIKELKSKLSITKPYIGFHIRSGDKSIEYNLLNIEDYINKAKLYTENANAFVLTDNFNIITSLKEKYPEWCFATLCNENETGYYHDEFSKKNKLEQRYDLLKLFASMDILENSDLFIGTYSSNPGMNMGYRMESRKIKALDFENWVIW